MPVITWDQIGDRVYETGLDHGVLYLPDGTGIAWNGLTSVVEKVASATLTPLYYNGLKYNDSIVVGDFEGVMKAFTYPDEFMQFEGVDEYINSFTLEPTGMFVTNQGFRRFSLSYRTKIGNDTDGLEHGYKIHILYNLLAVPSDKNFETLADSADPIEFEWTITGVPELVGVVRPTTHIIFDSRYMDADLLEYIETLLYGTAVLPADLPSLSELITLIDSWTNPLEGITIVDNGDGTWTAITAGTTRITYLTPTLVEISNVDTTVIDANSYTITDTP